MNRTTVPRLRTPALALCLLAALGGCKQEQTKPTVQSQQRSRLEAAQSAEMQRQAQQRQAQQDQPPPSPASAQTTGSQAATSGAKPGGQQAPAAQPYMPPSEQGAYVEMTETPAGVQPPAQQSPQAAGAQAPAGGSPSAQSAGPASGGDAGGNMPQTAASPFPMGTAGSPPPRGSGGMRPAPVAPPAVQGVSAPIPAGATQVGTLNSELERKLREFDELMKRAQIEADKERAANAAGGGRASGERDGRGGRLDAPPEDFGAGGAAEESSGLGASPDLSGQTGQIDERFGGPSPVRMEPAGDDDIVARQLREAAERETDPVLREKLWAEYRNYKGQ
jgi:hypothetical protein